MLYLDQANLLITGSWDSTIKVFDCKDETSILRIMTGGHQESEITCLVYSETLGLLASAALNGLIAIWDFDMGKLEQILIGHENCEVTCL